MKKHISKVVVVTGASRGIGWALTEQLLETKNYVIAWSRQSPPRTHTNLLHIPTDITQEDSVLSAYEHSLSYQGKIDCLVNNAGTGICETFEDIKAQDWKKVFDVNVYGAFLCAKVVIPHMKKRKTGHIIQVGSVAGLRGTPRFSAYCATKFALRGMSESLLLELRKYGIKVTYFAPGGVQTDFFENLKNFTPANNLMQSKDVAQTIVEILNTRSNYLPVCVEVRPLRPQIDE